MQYSYDPDRYAVDPLDGETIVMDLLNGRLFLLEEGAAVVWDSLTGGLTLEALEATIRARYGDAAAEGLHEFVAGLLAKGLLAEASGTAPAAGHASDGDWPAEFGALRLTEYDDMTSIITMDPIHDVDPRRGWPFDERK